ncbi:MAG: amidohydrolase family protein [Alphaproteobacteria bacterium]|nr:amidohydrolase family protein [Alphaproteobacteria bacterium]
MNANSRDTNKYCLYDCHAQILSVDDRHADKAINISKSKEIGESKQEDSLLLEYKALSQKLSVAGTVLLQPEDQGFDHQFLIKTISELNEVDKNQGTSKAFGVATLSLDSTDDELEELKASGIIAAQFIMTAGDEKYEWDEAERLAWRIHDLGWSVDLHMDGSDLHEVEQRLLSWPGYITLRHIGQFLRTKTLKQRGFKSLTRLIDRDKIWVKLSAPYQSSRRGLIDDPEVMEIAGALIKWAPERMIWGTNWPHLESTEELPNDSDLFRIFCNWIPEISRRKMILNENPSILYGF